MSKLNFSIIIAAKNEEHNLPALFKSLNELNYPKENYEIIFVNDQSTDNTNNVIENFIKNNPNARLLDSHGKKYLGKKGALDIGISHAKNEFIIITDGDCEPEPNWLNAFAVKFTDGNDFLFGIAPYIQSDSFVNKIACFENLRTQILTFTSAKIGLPFSAAARSFGFRKTSFMKIGGYENTTETLSGDDDLLLREAIKNKMEINTVEKPSAYVFSRTSENWKDYLNQKARHLSTSNYYLLKQKLFLGIWHLINISMLFSFFFGFINAYFFIPPFIKIIFDLVLIHNEQSRYGYQFTLLESIYFQIMYEFLLIVNYLRGTFGNIKWK